MTNARSVQRFAPLAVKRLFAAASLACLALLVAAPPAAAHVTIDGAGDFTGGLLHPFFVLSHLLVIVALGLFLAQQSFASAKLAIAAFVAALLGGFAAAALGAAAAFPSRGVLLSIALALGLLVAWARAQPRLVAMVLAAAGGLAMGVDSFPEAGTFWPVLASITGTGLSVSILLINVLAGAGYLTRDWQRIGMRVIGSWIGACALMVAALTLR